jgi:hypothetical protein
LSVNDIRTTWHDHGDEGAVIVRAQQVGAIVDQCKALSNEGFHGLSDFKHVARIPNVVVEHYCNTHGVSFQEFTRNPEHMRRIVNDPAFADLRIAPGKI